MPARPANRPTNVPDASPPMGVVCRILRPAYTEEEQADRAEFVAPSVNLSDRVTRVTLCGPNLPRKVAPTDTAPALVLVERELSVGPFFHAQPPTPPDEGSGHYSAGPNCLDTSDLYPHLIYPVRIFDRFERPNR